MNLSHTYGAPVSTEQGERVLAGRAGRRRDDVLPPEQRKTEAGKHYADQSNREVDTEAF